MAFSRSNHVLRRSVHRSLSSIECHQTHRCTTAKYLLRQQETSHCYHHAAKVAPISAPVDIGLPLAAQLQTLNNKSDIESLISSLPLVRYLRDWPKQMSNLDAPVWGETRLHDRHDASDAAKHLTIGSIYGRDKVLVNPHFFVQQGPPFRAITVCHIGTHLCGHPGYIHGGVPFSLFDDIFARLASTVFPSRVGMTANLDINFRKPCLPGRVYVIRAEIESLEGRKLRLRCTMRSLQPFTEDDMREQATATNDDLSIEEQDADIVAEATSLYIEPKFAQVKSPCPSFAISSIRRDLLTLENRSQWVAYLSRVFWGVMSVQVLGVAPPFVIISSNDDQDVTYDADGSIMVPQEINLDPKSL